MAMKKRIIWLLMFMMLGTGMYFSNVAHAENENNDAVKAAADNFYTALNAMFTGDAAPMKNVWAHTDDVVYMGPDGALAVGWSNIEKVWENQASKKMGGKVTADRMQITSDGSMGVTYNYEIGENHDADGNPVKVSIRATNVFQKNDAGEWKMTGHHTDLLPFLAEEAKS